MIKINDDYYIDVDVCSYIVRKDLHTTHKNKKTGEEEPKFSTVGYYPDVDMALRGAIKYMLRTEFRKDEIISLREAVTTIVEAYDRYTMVVSNALRGENV